MPETALARLLALLDLEKIEENLFVGLSPDEPVQRVFGGQVLAQALVAAMRTVGPQRPCHSFHAYFLRPGDPRIPIQYQVDRSRDGGSFTARRVVALQGTAQIFILAASFASEGSVFDMSIPQLVVARIALRPVTLRLIRSIKWIPYWTASSWKRSSRVRTMRLRT